MQPAQDQQQQQASPGCDELRAGAKWQLLSNCTNSRRSSSSNTSLLPQLLPLVVGLPAGSANLQQHHSNKLHLLTHT